MSTGGLGVAARLGIAVALGMIMSVATFSGALLDHADASQGNVRGCRPFVILDYRDSYGVHRFRAWDIKRSARLRCSMTRKLLKAAYGAGPLRVIKTVYEPGGSGRPTYWLRDGWRCGNGAGGASCFNAEQPAFNVIENYGAHGAAVTASTG